MSDIHIHVYHDGFGTTKPPQGSLTGHEEMVTESDQEREYRLMQKYSDKSQTLTQEEFDFLTRRGCVRY